MAKYNFSTFNQEETDEQNLPKTIEGFLGKMFQFRDRIHLAHLSVTSFAQHLALDDVYKSMLDTIDTLVESAQTDNILTITIPESTTNPNSNILQECLDYIRANRYVFPYSFQQNEIDSLEQLLSSNIYKIKFLH
jgi:hypothetical protein